MTSSGMKKRTQAIGMLNKPSSTLGKSTQPRAFYELPGNAQTSSQIVQESRDWLQAVTTRRPCTPREQTRSLFGAASQGMVASRPVSAFKVGTRNFDTSDLGRSRVSHLSPIETNPLSEECGTVVARGLSNRDGKSQRFLKRVTSFDEVLPSPRGLLPKSRTTSDLCSVVPKGTRKTAKPANQSQGMESKKKPSKPFETPKLELKGTTTKLLPFSAARHMSPTCAPSEQPLFTPRRDSSSTRRLNVIRSAEPQSGSRSLESPTPRQKRPSSGTRAGGIGSRLLDRVQLLPNSEANPPRPPSSGRSSSSRTRGRLQPQLSESIADVESPPRPNSPTSAWNLSTSVPRPEACLSEEEEEQESGLMTRNTSATHSREMLDSWNDCRKPRSSSGISRLLAQDKTDAQTASPNGDSGMSSGTELDHLLARLTELARPICSDNTLSPSGLEISIEDEQLTEGDHQSDMIPTQLGRSKIELTKPMEDEAVRLVDKLYTSMREAGLQGNQRWPQRATVLRVVIALMDWPSPRLHLSLSCVVLSLPVSGNNLASTCKLLYTVAKDTSNDALFLEHSYILDSLLATVQTIGATVSNNSSNDAFDLSTEQMEAELEALLFLTGSLKFLSTSPLVAKVLNTNPTFLSTLLTVHRQVDGILRRLQTLNPTDVEVTQRRAKKTSRETHTVVERVNYIIVQVSEIFCQLSTNPALRTRLCAPGSVTDHIADCLIYWHTWQLTSTPSGHSDKHNARSLVYFNWIRILARLTEHPDVCQRLEGSHHQTSEDHGLNPCRFSQDSLDPDAFPRLVRTLSTHVTNRMEQLTNALVSLFAYFPENEELAIRVAYLLGNLTARLDSAREALLPNNQALKTLCGLCRSYQQKKMATHPRSDTPIGIPNCTAWESKHNAVTLNSTAHRSIPSTQTTSEVLDKLVRVLANATINETVGHLVVTGPDCLNLFLGLIEGESANDPTELLLNCLAGMNNITYYINAHTSPDLCGRQCDVAEILLKTLAQSANQPDVMPGCIRVFGNLTRQPVLRNWLSRNDDVLSSLPQGQASYAPVNALMCLLIENLDSAQPELVYSTLGVLINLMADVNQRPKFKQLGGEMRLLEVLRDFAGHDWQLAGLACKTLWNYTDSSDRSIPEMFDGAETVKELYNLLSEFTDEELVQQIHQGLLTDDATAESDTADLWMAAWSSEFVPVAMEFLTRLSCDGRD